MDIKGILKIEKRPMPCWLIFWIFALPLAWGTIFHFLSLPAAIKYTADVAWIGLLCFMVLKRNIDVAKKIYPLVLLAVTFFLYCLVMYIVNYQSIVYFLWGMRNNFRFYVFFFAVVLYFRERDASRSFQILDILFWINVPVTLIQYFAFGYKQDFLGGIFGVETGANASTIIFFTIVLSRSLLKCMEQKEKLLLCASKCFVALFISALAELKFFFVFFIAILILSAFMTTFSRIKLLIFIVCAVLVIFASTLLVNLFDFEGFLSFENIWKSATQEHYSSEQTVNRLSAIQTLAKTLVTSFNDRLLGLGLGNCDTSTFAICNTPFYQTYGYFRYTYFSVAFLFLEVGYLGLLMYVAFFAFCFFMIRKRIKLGLCKKLYGNIAIIMAVLAIVLVVYNASLRAEAGYMVYFILALPFIRSDSLASEEKDICATNEEKINLYENC